jgi:hypothetical protein
MAPVGVPGLILGGGISHFASKLGWACDNVASFELVTASGLPITMSPTSHPDLFWALRGGGNNFGIVTNFKLNAFPLGQMWGGDRIYPEGFFPNVLDAISHFTLEGSKKDADAAQILVCLYHAVSFVPRLMNFRLSLPTPVLVRLLLSICIMQSQSPMHLCSADGTT